MWRRRNWKSKDPMHMNYWNKTLIFYSCNVCVYDVYSCAFYRPCITWAHLFFKKWWNIFVHVNTMPQSLALEIEISLFCNWSPICYWWNADPLWLLPHSKQTCNNQCLQWWVALYSTPTVYNIYSTSYSHFLQPHPHVAPLAQEGLSQKLNCSWAARGTL